MRRSGPRHSGSTSYFILHSGEVNTSWASWIRCHISSLAARSFYTIRSVRHCNCTWTLGSCGVQQEEQRACQGGEEALSSCRPSLSHRSSHFCRFLAAHSGRHSGCASLRLLADSPFPAVNSCAFSQVVVWTWAPRSLCHFLLPLVGVPCYHVLLQKVFVVAPLECTF